MDFVSTCTVAILVVAFVGLLLPFQILLMTSWEVSVKFGLRFYAQAQEVGKLPCDAAHCAILQQRCMMVTIEGVPEAQGA